MDTVPGGRYVGADGQWHDANGHPITPPEPTVTAEPAAEKTELTDQPIDEPTVRAARHKAK